MWHSLQIRLSLLFISFLCLVVGSVAITFRVTHTQQSDAALINVAGRQRMLTQQLLRLALTTPDVPQLAETAAQFQQMLTVLEQGGSTMDAHGRLLYLPPPTQPAIHTQLGSIRTQWEQVQPLLAPPIAPTQLQEKADQLLQHLDALVLAYESLAQAKIATLRRIQLAFLGGAFLLLLGGYTLVRHHLLQPLAHLNHLSEQIGAGQAQTAIPPLPRNEIGALGQTIQAMQAEIVAYQTSLERQVAQRTEELSAAFEFSQEIISQLETPKLLQSIAHRMRDLMQAEAASVCVLGPDGQTLELLASSGTGPERLGWQQSVQQGIALPVIQGQQTVVAPGSCTNCHFLHHFDHAPCMVAPLQVAGHSVGALCVVRSKRPFEPEEQRALNLLANTAAIALEKSRLIERNQQQAQENASLAERERLAADLHDNLAQTISAIRLSAEQLERTAAPQLPLTAVPYLTAIHTHLQSAYTQLRMALTGLREPPPTPSEFTATLQQCVAHFEQQTHISVQLDLDDEDALCLTALNQKQALYIVQEALANIRRHAQATAVQISATGHNGIVAVEIVDNGRGFDPTRVDPQHHLGLSIMHTRASRIQGKLHVESRPAQGTTVRVFIPKR